MILSYTPLTPANRLQVVMAEASRVYLKLGERDRTMQVALEAPSALRLGLLFPCFA